MDTKEGGRGKAREGRESIKRKEQTEKWKPSSSEWVEEEVKERRVEQKTKEELRYNYAQVKLPCDECNLIYDKLHF